MYKKSVNKNEIAVWGELVRRYLVFHKNENMFDICHWGLFNWGDVSQLIKKGYIHTKTKEKDKIVWCKPTKEIINLLLKPSADIAAKALEGKTDLDFGCCDTYVKQWLTSEKFKKSVDLKKEFLKAAKKIASDFHSTLRSSDSNYDPVILTDGYDITFEKRGLSCTLELRKLDNKTTSVVKRSFFRSAEPNKGWVTVDIVEKHLSNLFEDILLFN